MKTILVTGGNRGIGLEICRQLSMAGHTVILGSRNPEAGINATSSWTKPVFVRQLDVTDEESVQNLYQSLKAEFGILDVLINNAGTGATGASRETAVTAHLRRILPASIKNMLKKSGVKPKMDTAGNIPFETVQDIMETNFYGPWRMIQTMIPLLELSEAGRIINISSGMGQLTDLQGNYPGYRMSKSSLNALTIMFAAELRTKGMFVNAMCPGWVRTDMGGPDAPRSVEEGADTALWLATAPEIPTGKFFRDRTIISW